MGSWRESVRQRAGGQNIQWWQRLGDFHFHTHCHQAVGRRGQGRRWWWAGRWQWLGTSHFYTLLPLLSPAFLAQSLLRQQGCVKMGLPTLPAATIPSLFGLGHGSSSGGGVKMGSPHCPPHPLPLPPALPPLPSLPSSAWSLVAVKMGSPRPLPLPGTMPTHSPAQLSLQPSTACCPWSDLAEATRQWRAACTKLSHAATVPPDIFHCATRALGSFE